MTTALAPLRERNFRWFFAAEVTNLAGSVMAGLALAFAVLDVEDSPRALGYVLAAHSIPMVVFVLFGGVIADRIGRALVIQGSNLISGLSQAAIAALVLTGHAQLWQLIILSAINGTMSAAGMPALWGLIPKLVTRDLLQPANVLMSMSRNALAILGPTVAALLVAGVGPGWALAVDASTWLLSAALMTQVRLPPRETTDRAAASSVLDDLRDGWQVFWGTTWLWVVVLAFAGINMVHSFWGTLGPVIAKRTFGAQGWGLIGSAEAVGLLLMSLILTRVKLRRLLLPGVLGIALFVAPVGMLGFRPDLGLLIVTAFIAGFGVEVFGLGWNLAMQEHIPEEKLSRAYAYDMLGSFVAIPLGQLAAGPLAHVYGVRPVLIGGFCFALVLVLLMLCSRDVRTLQRLTTDASATDSPTSAPVS